MRRPLFIILSLHIFCISLFSREKCLEVNSLPVFTVIDKEVSAILDSFIIETQKCRDHYPSVSFIMYIDLYDNDDIPFGLGLELRKQEQSSDSIILYKHPNCRQVLVSHNDHLFQTIICKRPDFDNKIQPPNAILKKTETKQRVYYKEPSLDYFRENPVKGEIDYESQLLGWLYDYCHGQWIEAIKISF